MKIKLLIGVLFLCAAVTPTTRAYADDLFVEGCGAYCSGSNLYCIQSKNASGITLLKSTSKEICLPGPDYENCGSKYASGGTSYRGDCAKNNESCAIISSITNPKNFTAVCVPANIMVKPDSQPGCNNTSDCNLDQQCVKVSTINFTGTNTLYGTRRCVDKSFLPSNVLDETGSCGVNAKCEASQICVKNSYDPEHYPNVCYDKSNVSVSSICTDKTSLGNKCGSASEPNKICMQVADPAHYYQCVDATKLPGGPNAPSNITCIKDKDCAPTGKPFCVLNPATNKNQCFSQDLIFTLMTSPDSGSCKTAGTKGCKEGEPNSVCATYANDPSILLCIKGDALGSGAATVLYGTAAERSFRTTPQLEIDIPTVTFSDKIKGEKSEKGTIFDINYLATYINGAYKYGIGVGVLFAVFMLMVAGFRYMTAFGSAKAVSGATEGAKNATVGLIILFSAYTILYVIDPGLTQLKSIKIFAPKQEEFTGATPGEGNVVDENYGKQGALGGAQSSTATSDSSCAQNITLPFNPIATKYDGTSKNPDPNFFTCSLKKARDVKNISLIVLHEGGVSGDSTANIWISHSKDYVVASHYDISRTGQIIQFVPENLVANHTNGGGNGAAAKNSIGIDLDIPPKGCNQVSAKYCSADTDEYKSCNYTDAQYAALNKLIADIISRTKVKHDDDHIIQHCEVCGATHCDVRNFDWTKIGLDPLKHRTATGECIKRWHISGSCPAPKAKE